MKRKLKALASLNGYNDKLCNFLDNLEAKLMLYGNGRGSVTRALNEKAEDETIIKVALANIGRLLAEFWPDGKPENYDTTDYWAKAGEKEYKKHCDENGHFRWSDFK